jgi:hypothetical protein
MGKTASEYVCNSFLTARAGAIMFSPCRLEVFDQDESAMSRLMQGGMVSWGVLCSIAAAPGCAIAADTWPQFRGPAAGVADGNSFPDTWSSTKNIRWNIEVLGRGWSSPVVWGDKVFLTSVVTAGKFEDPKKAVRAERIVTSTNLHSSIREPA